MLLSTYILFCGNNNLYYRMKNRTRLLVVLLAGVLLGFVVGVEFVHFTGARVCPGSICIDATAVKPVTDAMYFDAVHDVLQDARYSIHLVLFEVKYYTNYPDSKENQLVEDLIVAAARGVDVKVIVDQYSRENNAFEYLRENGVDIRYDPEYVTTHSKLVIVDGKIVVLGSTNWSYYGLEKNHEANLVVEDAEVATYFEKYFQSLWS